MGLIAVFAEEGPKKGVGLIDGGFLVGLQSGGGGVSETQPTLVLLARSHIGVEPSMAAGGWWVENRESPPPPSRRG